MKSQERIGPAAGVDTSTISRLPANGLLGKWQGVGRLRGFRGDPLLEPELAEDWIGSTVSKSGQGTRGLSTLPEHGLLRDVIAADQAAWLGPDASALSATPELLVKLLDAGERLPLHVHPPRDFARAHLDSRFGKSEAWIILDAAPGAEVAMGFAHDVGRDELARWVQNQDTSTMLASVARLPVQTGDAIFCPAGMPHAIGRDIFLVEVEEPADLSLMLEWDGYAIDGRADGHLGLGFETALDCVDRSAWDLGRLQGLKVPAGSRTELASGVTNLLVPAADAFFRAQEVTGPRAQLEPGFSVLVVVGGAGQITSRSALRVPVRSGQTYVTPYATGPLTVEGDVRVLRLLPPQKGGFESSSQR